MYLGVIHAAVRLCRHTAQLRFPLTATDFSARSMYALTAEAPFLLLSWGSMHPTSLPVFEEAGQKFFFVFLFLFFVLVRFHICLLKLKPWDIIVLAGRCVCWVKVEDSSGCTFPPTGPSSILLTTPLKLCFCGTLMRQSGTNIDNLLMFTNRLSLP